MHIPNGYLEKQPTEGENRAVETCWSFLAEEDGRSTILPDGRSDIILRCKVIPNARVQNVIPIVTGPMSHSFGINYVKGDAWLGIRLRPSIAGSLFKNFDFDLRNKIYWNNKEAGSVVPEFFELSNQFDSLAELENLIRKIAFRLSFYECNAKIIESLDYIHLSGGQKSVKELSEAYEHSERHYNRTFSNSVGLSPKLYSMIIQFHRGLRLIKDNGLSATEAAYEAGYADQAHMIRCFRKFGDFSPAQIPQNIDLPRLPQIG